MKQINQFLDHIPCGESNPPDPMWIQNTINESYQQKAAANDDKCIDLTLFPKWSFDAGHCCCAPSNLIQFRLVLNFVEFVRIKNVGKVGWTVTSLFGGGKVSTCYLVLKWWGNTFQTDATKGSAGSAAVWDGPNMHISSEGGDFDLHISVMEAIKFSNDVAIGTGKVNFRELLSPLGKLKQFKTKVYFPNFSQQEKLVGEISLKLTLERVISIFTFTNKTYCQNLFLVIIFFRTI